MIKTTSLIKWIPFFLFSILIGCGELEIESVKNSTLKNRNHITIGQAIESALGNAEWSFFETEKGVRIVEVKGLPGKHSTYLLPYEYYSLTKDSFEGLSLQDLESIHSLCQDLPKITIQFILHANSDKFEVGACAIKDNPLNCSSLLDHIYSNDVTYKSFLPEACASINKEINTKNIQRNDSFKTVKIDEQIWMAENLNIKTPNSSCYNNDPENCTKYGRLYTWEDAQKACPENWHLPRKSEWITLLSKTGFDQLGLPENWNANTKNTYGFSTLPAGNKDGFGNFINLGDIAAFWTSTDKNNEEGIAFTLVNFGESVLGSFTESSKKISSSVRCIKGDAPTEKENSEIELPAFLQETIDRESGETDEPEEIENTENNEPLSENGHFDENSVNDANPNIADTTKTDTSTDDDLLNSCYEGDVWICES